MAEKSAPKELVRKAIKERKVITFTYAKLARTCEPHVLGVANGREQVLCWQFEGGSVRGDLPQWRRFDAADMLNMEVTERTFAGVRPVAYPHSKWDRILETV